MKVLLVNGSPRKGNTYRLLELVENRIKQEEIETELINIQDYNINECIGCYKCVTLGKNHCPFKDDDADKIWNKFASSNGVVLAAPVYALGIPSIFKRFIDRIAYNAHRPTFYNKPTMFISTTAGMGTENVFKQLQWFEIAGLRVITKIGYMVYPSVNDKEKTITNKTLKIRKAVERFNKELVSSKTIKPKLIQVIQFYGLKLNCHFGNSIYKADYEYYLNRDFFTNVKVNPIKNILGKAIYRIGIKALERTLEKT